METVLHPLWNMVSEIELVYKSKVKPSNRPLIDKASTAYKYYYPTGTKTILSSWNSQLHSF